MKHFFILVFIISILFSCNSSKSDEHIYEWHSYPSFHEGFVVKLSENSNELLFTKHINLYLLDSLKYDDYMQFMDSIQIEEINKFLPRETQVRKAITSKESDKILSLLKELCSCKEKDFMPGLDGTTQYFTKSKDDNILEECTYWSPQKSSQRGKKILELMKEVSLIFKNEMIINNTIENSLLYIDRQEMIIKNTNPLYVKIINLPLECNEMEEVISKLPEADEIYLDLTNYQGENKECYITNFYKKYKKLRWVKTDLSGVFTRN